MFFVIKNADGLYDIEHSAPGSLGQVTGTLGNFAVLVRALSYILSLGKEGLAMVGPLAALNANYIKERLRDLYLLPVDTVCKHEFVFDGLVDMRGCFHDIGSLRRLTCYIPHDIDKTIYGLLTLCFTILSLWMIWSIRLP